MTENELINFHGPAERELDELRAEIHNLSALLADVALESATTEAKLRSFEHAYMRRVGHLVAKLLDLEAQVLESQADATGGDSDHATEARDARERAKNAAREADRAESSAAPEQFEPTEESKSQFRAAAKRMHPDLAVDEADREIRTRAMAALNAAYQAGDLEELKRIVAEWDARPEAVAGDDPSAQLERARRKAELLRHELKSAQHAQLALRSSELHSLMIRAELSASEGDDFLAQIRAELLTDIMVTKEKLSGQGKA